MTDPLTLAEKLRILADDVTKLAAEAAGGTDLPAGYWPPQELPGSGSTGPGIDGSAAGAKTMLAIKLAEYSDPAFFGRTLNLEGRLFLHCVAKGYVPQTAAGLGTLLAYQGMGLARPSEITDGLKAFYAADKVAHPTG